MTTAKEFITRQLGTAGWAPIDEGMAKRLCPEIHQPHIDIPAYQRHPQQLPKLFAGAALYQADVDGVGRVLILSRSPQFLAERMGWLGCLAANVAPYQAETSNAPRDAQRKKAPTTSDPVALLHAGIETKEPPRPCKNCGNLGGGVVCLVAARGELEGAPRDYEPDTQWPRRCLSYVPPRADRDEILGRDGRTGRQLWPEIVAP